MKKPHKCHPLIEAFRRGLTTPLPGEVAPPPPPPRAAKRRRRGDDLTPRITQNAMPTTPRTFLSEAELAAELSTSAPRLARARAAGRIRHDAVCARGCSRLYARERLAELRAALSK